MYKITEIQDISRPRCKRFVAHVQINATNKRLIKKIIHDVTQVIKHNKGSSVTEKKFGDQPAHVVKLYIHSSSGLLCQSTWVTDKKQFLADHREEPYSVEIQLPKPQIYDEYEGDIGIVWRF